MASEDAVLKDDVPVDNTGGIDSSDEEAMIKAKPGIPPGVDDPDATYKKRGFARVKGELRDFLMGYRMTAGDWGSFTQLFFDNLSTLLGAVFNIQAMTNFGVPANVIDETVWGRIVPGVGITFILGNSYYTWMGIRCTNKYGRKYTANPFGLNTPAAFAFVFNIMYPVYFSVVDSLGPQEAFITAYKVTLAANFITGFISTFLALFGPLILQYVPPAALLVPIAGVGLAFLGLEQTSNSLAAPIVGYYAIMWVFIGWFAGVRLGYRQFRLPEAFQIILFGTALGWITGLNDGQKVADATKLVKWWGPAWTANELFADFGLVKDYLGIVIPIGISATATSLMCLVSAQAAGDPYPVRETMIADGLFTMTAALFGSTFGTVVYIGHPAHKRSGALVGYSLTNGIIYLIMSWFGILALIQSVVNQATIGPIVLFVGLMVNEEALTFMPARHYSAYVIGLFPSIYDWVVNVSGMAPIQDADTGGNVNLTGLPQWYGVLSWKRGALLVSFVWVAMIVMVIDRKWKMAAIWSLVAAVFAAIGLIHVPEAGFENFTSPTWEQCVVYDTDCWPYAEQWMFFTAYMMLLGTFALLELSRRFSCDDTLLPHIPDAEASAFDDWFKDAAVATVIYHPGDSLHPPDEEVEELGIVDESDHSSLYAKEVRDDLDPTDETEKVKDAVDDEEEENVSKSFQA